MALLCCCFAGTGSATGLGIAKNEAESVSFIRLLATPEKYNSKPIRVNGVGYFGFEYALLCLDFESIEYNMLYNCISVGAVADGISMDADEILENYNKTFIVVEGVFQEREERGDSTNKSRLRLGKIGKVNYIDKLYSLFPVKNK